MYNYITARNALHFAIANLAILAGDDIGPSDSTWQDVAGTAIANLSNLVSQLESAREERIGSIVFPSPSECLSALYN